MKTCILCKESKPLSEFYGKTGRIAATQSYCKPCFNKYTTQRFRSRKKQAVAHMGGKCADCCGVFPYYVFEFHHLDPTQKDVQFNTLRRRSWEAIRKELAKCVMLCANCHRVRHWRDFDDEGEFPTPWETGTETIPSLQPDTPDQQEVRVAVDS